MVKSILVFLSGIIIHVIQSLGFGGIVLAMAIESACIPLPSEIIMPFGGYLVATGVFASKFGPWMALVYISIAGALGCLLGSIVAYAVGIWGGRPLLDKYGKYILISGRDLDTADRWFKKYGEAAIFFSRLMPVVRTFISLPAGIARMNFPRFLFYTFTGSLPWCFLLGLIGWKVGAHAKSIEAWEKVMELRLGKWMHVIDIAILAGIIALIIWYIRRHISHKKKAK
jgi:membrane protein DedA with SNARE-associated domain